jgi:acetyltransferase-like isoleucine patch superfamily enzyme
MLNTYLNKIVSLSMLFIYPFILYLWNFFITYIPFHLIRNSFISLYLKKIGTNSSFMIGVQLKSPKSIQIGNNVVINSNVLLDGRGGLEIGNNTDIAREVIIWSMTHLFNTDHSAVIKKVTIGEDCWIGSRSQILPGVILGNGVVVGCGSIVTKSFPEFSIIAGNPAKVIGIRSTNYQYKLNYFPWFQ